MGVRLPNNWDQLESEYYRHFDPYDVDYEEENEDDTSEEEDN